MTRDELVAALKARKEAGLPYSAERLAEALEVAIGGPECTSAACKTAARTPVSYDWLCERCRARAAFLQSLTGTTTRETERP